MAPDGPSRIRRPTDGTPRLNLVAGVAGTTAARELSTCGYETPILETRSFAGGRYRTAHRGFTLSEANGVTQRCLFDEGQYITRAPSRIP